MLRGLTGVSRSIGTIKMVALASGDATRKRGPLIVFEGLDRSGKSTQAKKIVETLNAEGLKAVYSPFPDRKAPKTGQIINHHLQTSKSPLDRKEAIHLIFSQNRWEKIDGLLDELNDGRIVILDRYVASGVSYTMAKGLPKWFTCAADIGLPQPDFVVYLDVSPEVAQKRGNYGDEAFEKTEFQSAVRLEMEEFRKHPTWKTIDANQTEEKVHEDIKQLIFQLIGEDLPTAVDRIKPEYFGEAKPEAQFSPKEFEFKGTRGALIAFDGNDEIAEEFSKKVGAEIIRMTCPLDDVSAREKALTLTTHFWDQHEEILKKLSAGGAVILLDYFPSVIRTFSGKIEDKEWLNSLFYGLPAPDIVVSTDTNAAAAKNGWIAPSSDDKEATLEELHSRLLNCDPTTTLKRLTTENFTL